MVHLAKKDLVQSHQAYDAKPCRANFFVHPFSFIRRHHLTFPKKICFIIAARSSSLSDTVGSFARAVGMEQCGHMAICDAHARRADYGILALPLVLLFPG